MDLFEECIEALNNNAKICDQNLDLEFFDNVVAVSPITWFFCPSEGWVIQVDGDDTITIGFI